MTDEMFDWAGGSGALENSHIRTSYLYQQIFEELTSEESQRPLIVWSIGCLFLHFKYSTSWCKMVIQIKLKDFEL